MARHKSALKAARQATKRNIHNSQARASVRTAVKKMRSALAEATSAKGKTNVEQIQGMLSQVQQTLMKAASKNLIKAGNASRQVARLSKAVHRTLGVKA